MYGSAKNLRVEAPEAQQKDARSEGRPADLQTDVASGRREADREVFAHGRRNIAAIRRFLEKQLRQDVAEIEGATFTVIATLRKAAGGLRYKRLVSWREGESFESALALLRTRWEALPKEEAFREPIVVDIDIP